MEQFAKNSYSTLLSKNKVGKGIEYALKGCTSSAPDLTFTFKWRSTYASSYAIGTSGHSQKPQYFSMI